MSRLPSLVDANEICKEAVGQADLSLLRNAVDRKRCVVQDAPKELLGSTQRLLNPPALSDVSGDALDRNQLARYIVDRFGALLDPDRPAIFAKPAARNEGLWGAQCLLDEVPIVGVHDLEAQLGVGIVLLGCVADYGGGRRTHVLEAGGGLETVAVDEILGILCQEPEAFLTTTKLLHLLDFGNVRGNADDAFQVSLFIMHWSVGDHGSEGAAVLTLHHELS